MSFASEQHRAEHKLTTEEINQQRQFEWVKRGCMTLCIQCNWKVCPKVHGTKWRR